MAADTLVAACTGTEAHVDGQVHTLPPLGLKLCEEIGLEGAENDLQAVLLLFPSEMAVVKQFVAMQEAEETANGRIDVELEFVGFVKKLGTERSNPIYRFKYLKL